MGKPHVQICAQSQELLWYHNFYGTLTRYCIIQDEGKHWATEIYVAEEHNQHSVYSRISLKITIRARFPS